MAEYRASKFMIFGHKIKKVDNTEIECKRNFKLNNVVLRPDLISAVA